eukprot:scaffold3120_cov219-Skeletonema_marinoi.AAC.6
MNLALVNASGCVGWRPTAPPLSADYDVFVKKTSSRCSGHAGVAAGETKVLRSDGDGCYAAWYGRG